MKTENGVPVQGTAQAFPCPICQGWAHHVPINLVSPSSVVQVGAYEVCLDCGYSPASPAPVEEFHSEEWQPTTTPPTVTWCPSCEDERLHQVEVIMTKGAVQRRVGVWAVCTHCRYTPWSLV